MKVAALKQAAYDPLRYANIETVEEAIQIITTPIDGMTARQRWEKETPALMELIERFIKPGSFVLDYGCGIGRLAKPLINKLGCSVVGVDISANMRALAASCVDSPKFCAMAPEMFESLVSDVDHAIAVWTLQHCNDLESSINRIADTVIENGHLFVVNNKGRCVPMEGGEWADDGQDVEKMIVAAGFEEIEHGPLDEKIAPGWMREGTFWAVYQRI